MIRQSRLLPDEVLKKHALNQSLLSSGPLQERIMSESVHSLCSGFSLREAGRKDKKTPPFSLHAL
jgi:hypothetical protein